MKWLILVMLLLSGCSSAVYDNGNININFCPEDDCESQVAKLIASANESIDCAFYSLSSDKIIKAIEESNVKKRFVFNKEIKYHKGLMHNKFCIIDESIVFTGSYNPNGLNYKNNIVIIESEHLAKNYLDEFNELYDYKFSKGAKVKYSKVYVDDVLIENYFCPDDKCDEKVKEILAASEESVYFFIFSFTDHEIANILLSKNVHGLLESAQNSKWSVYPLFKDLDVELYTKGVMHNKVFVIDNKTVITGSWNPTKNGSENNDENLLIIHSEEIAMKYVEKFLEYSQ
ncbi:MAG: hypothetical protein KKB39_05760 [Nanoarchaeota archaeon]|nr:hypothetical protein [Nanoarchaeota archaeon]